MTFLYRNTLGRTICTLAMVCGYTVPAAAQSRTQAKPTFTTTLETGPSWTSLSPAQQHALKPIQTDWAVLDSTRKKKWLAVAQRYATLPAADQAQMHTRMQAWGNLSPAQRQTARDSYAQTLSSPNSKPIEGSNKANLNEQWVKYQALPPERRAALQAAAAEPRKRADYSTSKNKPLSASEGATPLAQ